MRGKDFVVTARLPLDSGTVGRDVESHLEALRNHVDAVQLGDDEGAQPHISPLAAASLALQAGVDPVLHLTCRDRNRIALQGDLMGAAAIGVTSLVLTRGRKLPASLKQKVKGVFDIGAQRLLATAQALNAHERLIAPPGFFLGSNVTALDPPGDWAAEGVDEKAGAGVHFVQTQPCLDVETMRRYMAALVARKALERLSVVVQVPLIDSLDMLQELRLGDRPLLITPAILDRLERAVDIRDAGEAVCGEVLAAVKRLPGVNAVNVLYRGDAAAVVRVISGIAQAGVASPR